MEDQEAGGGQRGGAFRRRHLRRDDEGRPLRRRLRQRSFRRLLLLAPPGLALLQRADVLGLGPAGPVPQSVGEVELQGRQVGPEAVRLGGLFGPGLKFETLEKCSLFFRF